MACDAPLRRPSGLRLVRGPLDPVQRASAHPAAASPGAGPEPRPARAQAGAAPGDREIGAASAAGPRRRAVPRGPARRPAPGETPARRSTRARSAGPEVLDFDDEDVVELVARAVGGPAGPSRRLAARTLDAIGGVTALASRDVPELVALGWAPTAAERLLSSLALARRIARARLVDPARICTPEHAASALRDWLADERRECFVVLGLDTKSRVIVRQIVAVGSLAHVEVHPRELFGLLVRRSVHAAVLAHNHPSGDPSPSDADLRLTLRMVDAGQLLGIPVVDHLVVAREGWVSLAQLGLIPAPP